MENIEINPIDCGCEENYYKIVQESISLQDFLDVYFFVPEVGEDRELKYVIQCPFCQISPCIIINSQHKVILCARESCGKGGTFVTIEALLNNKSLVEAALSLAKKFKVSLKKAHSNECRSTSSS